MAQPTNTLDSYDVRGIREDLQDIIYDISPEETPFYTKSAKAKATNTLHEWQTDALRSSADNAHIEGGDTAPEARAVTTRLGNYSQIFKNAVAIPGTDDGLNKAGRAREMAYQVLKIAKEQKEMEASYLKTVKTDKAAANRMLNDFNLRVMKDAEALTDDLTNQVFTVRTQDIQADIFFANKAKKD